MLQKTVYVPVVYGKVGVRVERIEAVFTLNANHMGEIKVDKASWTLCLNFKITRCNIEFILKCTCVSSFFLEYCKAFNISLIQLTDVLSKK